jgi:hypothetical protein
MEASESQLPIEPPDQDGTVRLVDDRLVIEGLTVADEQTARVIRERAGAGEEPAKVVRRAIEIGARVLDREDAAVEVDFVRREYERAMAEHRRDSERQSRETVERVEQELRRAFGEEAGGGRLAEALDSHTRELEEAIDSTFGDGNEESVQRRINALIEERNEAFLQRLSADDELNPLRPLLSSFGKWIRERRETQDERDEKLERKLDELLAKASEAIGVQSTAAALAEAEEAGTRKGRSFEDSVHEALERIATARGDAALHVGDEPGAGGSKKGDVVVEIGAAEGTPCGRIVFEVKDARLSRPKAWEELNGALAARAASFAVLVVAGEESLPPEREQLHEYEGNKLIVAVDPDQPDDNSLDVAYRFARLRVLLARESELTVDAPGVRDAASEARAALDAMKAIKSALSKATNNVEHARGAAEVMVATVLDHLERIEALVSDVQPEPAGELEK